MFADFTLKFLRVLSKIFMLSDLTTTFQIHDANRSSSFIDAQPRFGGLLLGTRQETRHVFPASIQSLPCECFTDSAVNLHFQSICTSGANLCRKFDVRLNRHSPQRSDAACAIYGRHGVVHACFICRRKSWQAPDVRRGSKFGRSPRKRGAVRHACADGHLRRVEPNRWHFGGTGRTRMSWLVFHMHCESLPRLLLMPNKADHDAVDRVLNLLRASTCRRCRRCSVINAGLWQLLTEQKCDRIPEPRNPAFSFA